MIFFLIISFSHPATIFKNNQTNKQTNMGDGWQTILRDSGNKGMAAMLVEQTKEVLEKTFLY